jgi:RHS repeat-associated protein
MDTSAVVVERYGYTAFGECRVMTGAFGSRTSSSYDWETRYGAYRWDAETGLCQVRHRYLHPGLGRWVTRDPIGYEAGENFYKYIFNQTTNRVDPPGLGYDINRPPNVIIGPDEARYGYPNPGAINPKPAPSSIYTMGGPVDSVLYYKICGERPGELGPYLEQALERLQREQNWPVGSNINFCISDYWSWDHPVDCLMIGFTLGQFRFTNDGTNTTISDYYAFPFGDDHNEVLAVFDTLTIPGRPFPVSGGWQTPPQTAPVRELLPPRLNPIVPIYPNNGGINSPPGRLIR